MPRTSPWWKGKGSARMRFLTRRRGDAETSAEKRRSQREDERGDSGGWWPSVRSGRAFRTEDVRAWNAERSGGAVGLWTSLMRVSTFLFATLLVSSILAAQDADPGRLVFEGRCARCHGADGNGGELGPAIRGRLAARTNEQLVMESSRRWMTLRSLG